ncbi:hypothetical protein [Tautonia rosea]|uniref:hypothetical protein n=1 Tax=Tautonia rosea TaxID=2728037 RepID=UPI0014751AB6|nr:hypothetical protein [Tautonia rosea]
MSLLTRVARGLILAMALGLVTPITVNAQDPGLAPAGEESEGKPLFGYLAAGAGCIAMMFAISLSARR